jgi:hypothetical protein
MKTSAAAIATILILATLNSALAQDPMKPAPPLPEMEPAQQPPEIVPPEKREPATPERIKQLIEQFLDKDRFRSNDAKHTLWSIGKPALPLLKESLKTASAVQASKINSLIRKIEAVEVNHGLGPRVGGMLNQLNQIQRPPVIQQNQGAGGRNFNQQVIPLGPGANRPQPPAGPDFSTNLKDTFGCRLVEAGDGLRVIEVRPGSPAATAGITEGDLLRAVNCRELKTANDAKQLLAAGQHNPIKLDITRKGETLEVLVPKF